MILYQTDYPSNATEENAPIIEMYTVYRNIGETDLLEGYVFRLSSDVRTVEDIRGILARDLETTDKDIKITRNAHV